MSETSTERLRQDFARMTVERADVGDPRIEAVFAQTPRENFAGPGPWAIVEGGGYQMTPDSDPARLYRNRLVAIDAARGVNIGEPVLHALCLDALALREGETVVHVGAGVGYYTAMLALLVGARGRVFAYEIDPAIASRAKRNLATHENVEVLARSGVTPDLPAADVIYVNAAAVEPMRVWRDALRPGGRLLFPLQAPGATGLMALITRPQTGAIWPTRFLCLVNFIACETERDVAAERRLAVALDSGGWSDVRALRFDTPDESCWLAGEGWWFSRTAPTARD
jgi:protein-L-isoaspartate(D-aspartate) O-methyltransferase